MSYAVSKECAKNRRVAKRKHFINFKRKEDYTIKRAAKRDSKDAFEEFTDSRI